MNVQKIWSWNEDRETIEVASYDVSWETDSQREMILCQQVADVKLALRIAKEEHPDEAPGVSLSCSHCRDLAHKALTTGRIGCAHVCVALSLLRVEIAETTLKQFRAGQR